jgi:hypothetical protein
LGTSVPNLPQVQRPTWQARGATGASQVAQDLREISIQGDIISL